MEGGRKQPREDINKVLVRSLGGQTLAATTKMARLVQNQTNAGVELTAASLKRADKKFGRKEAIQFFRGGMLKTETKNKKRKRTSFNGALKKRAAKDTP